MPKVEKSDRIASLTRKLHRYIGDGRHKKLSRIAARYRKHDADAELVHEVNRVGVIDGQLTYLHKFSLEGDTAMVCCLMQLGADLTCLDANFQAPLHAALDYVLRTLDMSFFENAVLEMIGRMPERFLDERNKYGETPNHMIEEIMENLHKEHDRYLQDDDEDEDFQDTFDDSKWNEKLMNEFALETDCCEDYASEEHVDTFEARETFEEWGDRMFSDYQKKQRLKEEALNGVKARYKSNNGHARTSGEGSTPSHFLSAPKLELPRTDDLRKRVRLLKEREVYEERCCAMFGDATRIGELSFADVPWPLRGVTMSLTSVDDAAITGMLEMFTFEFTVEEKLKYLKKQQVRWHPDRFRQACGERLSVASRDIVMATVKLLSQIINNEVRKLRESQSQANTDS